MTAIGPEPTAADAEDLLRKAREGDAEAFCLLAGREESRLLRRAWLLCGDAVAAEDLVAETLIAAWQGLARFDGLSRFSTWLHGILLRRHLKQARAAAVRPVAATRLARTEQALGESRLSSAADPSVEALSSVLGNEVAARVQRALASLPPEHRAVLSLRLFEEASLEEISRLLELPLGTVKSRLHHGLEKLRKTPEVLGLRQDWRSI